MNITHIKQRPFNHNFNQIIDADSYKWSQWLQYPPNTVGMYSYLESRGGKYDKTVFFGLQYILAAYLSRPVSIWDVLDAEDFAKAHGVPFNKDGWLKIVEKHNGFMPVRIKAVPEGTVVPTKNILMSVESTDPELFWAVSWLETMLMRLWYPITVATQSYHMKQTIRKYLNETADNPNAELPYKLYDFGSRGVTSAESGAIAGAAHLVNFQGSDNTNSIIFAKDYYGEPMAAVSIPASEHSTITSWGRKNEVEAYRNMIKQFGKPGAIFACVSDSYDLYNAVSNLWGGELRDEVIKSGATVVVRPDSGDPATVVVQTLRLLAQKFGTTKNSKNYSVLNHVRVIQGDGITADSIEEILAKVKTAGFSASNVTFGSGGALLQKLDRDTQKFAFKCSEITLADGTSVDVFKEPITDPGKRSKAGRLALIQPKHSASLQTVRQEHLESGETDFLETVYENGNVLRVQSLEDIRARSEHE